MSHTSGEVPHHPAHPPHPAEHVTITFQRRSSLLQIGGGLGIAAFSIGLLIFLGACFGFSASLVLAPLPVLMGVASLVLTVIGGVMDEHAEGPAVVAGLFISVAAIVGGLLEWAAWQGWRLFA
jgi:hypothetical protein